MFHLLLVSVAVAAWPVSGSSTPDVVQDPFGPRVVYGSFDWHRGLDLQAAEGDPVHAVAAGKVVRVETAAANVGTARERFGNWVLVQHANDADGTPVHTAYLHLSAISVSVGKKVREGTKLGEAGHTGVGIVSDHVHLQAYAGLSGTAIDKDRSISPFRVMPYTDGDAVAVAITGPRATVVADTPALDLVRVEVDTATATYAVDFETGEGLCGDVAVCGDLEIVPADMTAGDPDATWAFEVLTGQDVVAARAYDVAGLVASSP